MGEWSKRIGEFGEEVVFELFKLIGWSDARKGIELQCIHGAKHGAGNERRTHGIDAFFSHQSNLADRTLDHLVISVKYSQAPYPANPTPKFKEHFRDLAKTLECFRKSSLRSETGRQFACVNNARNIGVLFWLTGNRANQDVISSLASARQLDEYAYEAIFVVDDYRAAFLFDSISFVRSKFKGSTVEFLYPHTGRNINPATREAAGGVLPVEYINSSVLLFRITANDGRKSLVLACIESFHLDRLRRLIGLAQEITSDFAAESYILFPDFDALGQGNMVREAKIGFEDKRFTETVSVGSFRPDFREAS